MSASALLRATVWHLQKETKLTEAECQVMNNGQPPPGIGDRFVAIHLSSWSLGVEGDTALIESYNIEATVTFRIPQFPKDRTPILLFAGTQFRDMEKLCRRVIIKTHLNYDLLHEANNYLDTDDTNLFVEPLRFSSSDSTPRTENGLWASETVRPEDAAFLVMSLSFIRAVRTQNMTEVD